MVIATIIYQAFQDDDMSKRSSTPFRENIIAGLLSGYPREVRRPSRHASLPAPLWILSSSIDCGPLRVNINAMWVTALCALTATRRGAGPCMNASNVGNPCVCILALIGTMPSWTSRCHAQGRTCTRVRLAAAMMTLILFCQDPPGHHHRHPSPQPRRHCQRPGELPVA